MFLALIRKLARNQFRARPGIRSPGCSLEKGPCWVKKVSPLDFIPNSWSQLEGSSMWLMKGKLYPESLEWSKHLRGILNCRPVLGPQDWKWAQSPLLSHSCGLRVTPGEGTGKQGGLEPLHRQGFPWTAWQLLTDALLSHYHLELYHPHEDLSELGCNNLEPVTVFTW